MALGEGMKILLMKGHVRSSFSGRIKVTTIASFMAGRLN